MLSIKKPQQTPHQRRSHLTLSLVKPCWHPKHRNSLKVAWNNPVQQRASERDDSETWGEIVTECSGISREILVLWHCTEAGEYLIILSVQFYTLKYTLDWNGVWYFMLVLFCTYPQREPQTLLQTPASSRTSAETTWLQTLYNCQ